MGTLNRLVDWTTGRLRCDEYMSGRSRYFLEHDQVLVVASAIPAQTPGSGFCRLPSTSSYVV